MSDNSPTDMRPIETIFSRPHKKAFADLRDRAAYMFITGCFPTHLRTETNELLRLISEFSHSLSSLDRRSGNLKINKEAAIRLSLDDHPMVTKVRQYLAEGYRITVSRNPNARRPYGRIFLSHRANAERRISVKCDGSILDQW